MRVRHRFNGAESIVEVDSRIDGYTVADLIAALRGEVEEAGGRTTHGLRVDGCWHGPDTPLPSVPIWEGALLEIAPGFEQPSSQSPQEQNSRPSRRAALAVTAGLQAGTRLQPPQTDSWVIGRSEGCDLVIDDPTISRRHARVTVNGTGKRLVIGDLGSRNGTVVAGRAVAVPTRVPIRATIRLGATCLQWRAPVGDAPAAGRAGVGAAAGGGPVARPP
ncbi:MAG: FHA domain-containing protein, partial [Acidimicrobiaceae bacterium]|nr:FHA domain-containing protein [Acidimicrobiaceae bacterium]